MTTAETTQRGEKQLLRLVQNNNLKALKALFLMYGQEILTHIQKQTQSEAATKHILKRVLKQLWVNRHHIKSSDSARALFFEQAEKFIPSLLPDGKQEIVETEIEVDLESFWNQIIPELSSTGVSQRTGPNWANGLSRFTNRFLPQRRFRPTYLALLIVLFALLIIHYWQAGVPKNASLSIKTGPGEQRELPLADGSIATLAPLSQLEYQRHFSDSLRVLFLQGRAQFQAKPGDNRPFAVITPGAAATVFSTDTSRFTVWTHNDSTYVSVQRGIVALCPVDQVNAREIYIYPGSTLGCGHDERLQWGESASEPISEKSNSKF